MVCLKLLPVAQDFSGLLGISWIFCSLDIFGQVFWESLEDVVVGYYEDP